MGYFFSLAKYNNNKFRYNREDYKSFYDVYMLFVDAKDRKINDTKGFPTITASFDKTRAMVEPDIDGYIIVNYKDTYNNTYSYVYEGAKFYPSQPKEIKIYRTNDPSENSTRDTFTDNHYYEITYADDTKYNSSTTSHTEKESCGEPDIIEKNNNTLEVTYKIKNPFRCVMDGESISKTQYYRLTTIETGVTSVSNITADRNYEDDVKQYVVDAVKSIKLIYRNKDDSDDRIEIDKSKEFRDLFDVVYKTENDYLTIYYGKDHSIYTNITLEFTPSTTSEVHQ